MSEENIWKSVGAVVGSAAGLVAVLLVEPQGHRAFLVWFPCFLLGITAGRALGRKREKARGH